jgi:ankyrin repeat protein
MSSRNHSSLIAAVVLLTCGIATAQAAPLIDAARKGDSLAVRALLKERTDVNATEVDGSTALLWAAYRSDADTVKLLLAARAQVNAVNRYGMTPLLEACRNGNAEIVAALLKAGANTQAAVRLGETPLMAAAGAGNSAIVKLLIDAGADVNAREPEQDQTALMWAVDEGHLAVVQQLLAAGADPNTVARANTLRDDLLREGGRQMVSWSRGGLTPLMFAARNGHLDVARALVDAGAKLDVKTPDGLTPMLLAVVNDWTDLAALLLERGANPDDGSLHEAIVVHNLRRGATASDASRPRPDNLNTVEPLDLVARLLARGADPNLVVPYTLRADGFGVPTPTNASAYVKALQSQDVAAVRLMLDAKRVDPNAPTASGTLPLMEVSVPARGGLFSGAGEGGFRHAGDRGSVATAELLRVAGADVNGRNKAGETPLHRAAQNGEISMIKWLAKNGATLDAKSAAGLTPLDIAMGKRPPAEPGARPEFGGGPPRGPRPEVVAVLRELMGLPPAKEGLASVQAGN